MKHEESKLQQAMVKWFRYQYPTKILFAIPNGGQRSIITAKILKGEGVLKGVPDLMIPEPVDFYCGLFVEVKVGYNKPSTEQADMIFKLTQRGYKCEVVYAFDAFEKCVNDYFKK